MGSYLEQETDEYRCAAARAQLNSNSAVLALPWSMIVESTWVVTRSASAPPASLFERHFFASAKAPRWLLNFGAEGEPVAIKACLQKVVPLWQFVSELDLYDLVAAISMAQPVASLPSQQSKATAAVIQPKTLRQNVMPFIIGGTSGMIATTCVQPVDMIKVRMQLTTSDTSAAYGRVSAINVLKDIIKSGKFLDLYNGLSAALARQIVYGTARLGLFVRFEQMLKERAEIGQYPYSFAQRALASMSAGAIAAAVGNPTEVALIRMQSDGMLPANQRQNYRSVIDAVARIVRSEGVLALWRGCNPTIIRAISTNFGQLACFSETKHQLKARTNLSDWTQSLLASANGGFCAAFFSMPFDTVKSRLQSRQAKYRGMLHCFSAMLKEEGPRRFYRGFPAYLSRLGPHS